MYDKPDLDTPLADLRTNITAWQASLERHLSEERKGKGLTFDVQLMEDRDDIAAKIVENFTAIYTEMSKRRVIDSAAPAAWSIDRLTDAELAAAKADWPELAAPGPPSGAAGRVAVLGVRPAIVTLASPERSRDHPLLLSLGPHPKGVRALIFEP